MPHPWRPRISSDLFHHQRVFLSAVKNSLVEQESSNLRPFSLWHLSALLLPCYLSSYQEATLPKMYLFKKTPPLFLSAGFAAHILLPGFLGTAQPDPAGSSPLDG